MRDGAAAAAASDRAAAASDPASCGRLADRNAALHELVAEGFGLVEQGRELVSQAAAQVTMLRGLIDNDRALCSPMEK